MKYNIFFWGCSLPEENINVFISKLDFGVSRLNAIDAPDSFYDELYQLLNSDWAVVCTDGGLTFRAGLMLMAAKMYKIPMYFYGDKKHINVTELDMCMELGGRCFETQDELILYLNEVYRNHKLPKRHYTIDAEDVISRIEAFDAGYDTGYAETEGFWGDKPAHFVQLAASYLLKEKVQHEMESVNCGEEKNKTIRCIDLGCGTGKNAIYLSKQGFSVEGYDSSYYAISQAKALSKEVQWKTRDVRKWKTEEQSYDLIVMAGLLHCYFAEEEIEKTVSEVKYATKINGYNVISVFNDGFQDLHGHPDDFVPLLMSHDFYMKLYADWTIIASSDSVLNDIHPNNRIRHRHSITRILARRDK